MNTNNSINNAFASILNAATITASASLSASAGIYFKPNNTIKQAIGLNLDAKTTNSADLAYPRTSNSCLNTHTLFKSDSYDEQDTFLNDKLLHQIGTNLVDLTVCWHKMTQKVKNSDIDADLIEKLNPLDMINEETLQRTDELTKQSFQEEFSSLIIKSTYDRTGFDASLILDANKNQPFNKLANQLQFLTIQDSNSSNNNSTKTLIEQIKVYNKYNHNKYTEFKYNVAPDENEIEITGLIKIHWNLKNPIKLTNSSQKLVNNSNVEDFYSSFKATSIRDLNKKKKEQTSLDDTFSSNDSKKSSQFFRNQTVKVKSMSKSSNRASLFESDLMTENKMMKKEDDEMFIPSYGSTSSICVDNKTTCNKAIKILLEKFHIQNSPDDYSLYKIYQSGEIQELKQDDCILIQRLYMGPFNEDKIFIMEKGRCVNMDPDVLTLISLPESLLNALIESTKTEENKEINGFKAKFKVYRDLLQHRLKFLE